MARGRIAALLLLVAVFGPAPLLHAEDDPSDGFVPDVVTDLPLDGLLDEPEARQTPVVRAEPVEVPDGRGGMRSVRVTVTVVVVDGALRVGVIAPEPPGLGMGLSMMLAADGTASAAEAVAISYAPQDVRASRLAVRGPRGVGRGVYRVEAAAAVTLGDRWGVEVQVPLADLGLTSPMTPLRLAVAARTRASRIVTWIPRRAAFGGPATWLRLKPPASGWPLDAAPPSGESMAAEDESDRARVDAWNRFLVANQSSVEGLVVAAGIEGGALEASDEQIRQVMRDALVLPLIEGATLRPDLAMLHVVRGHVLRLLGWTVEANEAYGRALEIVPALPEALFGRWLGLAGSSYASDPAGSTTDFAARLGALDVASNDDDDGFIRDGHDFARGQLLHLQGDFVGAAPLLGPLAERYPFSQSIVFAAEGNRSAVAWWARELFYRESDTKKGGLPRARVKTSKGEFVLELFAHDAPNTVDNFVWLAKHGFYDGAEVSTVPFFAVRVAEHGDPGYAIPTEFPPTEAGRPGARRDARRRRPFRGTVALLSHKQDAGAGAIVLFTGTALHLQGEYVAFGRILEGLEILEKLTGDDRILGVVIEDPGSSRERRPITVEGKPAPVPR